MVDGEDVAAPADARAFGLALTNWNQPFTTMDATAWRLTREVHSTRTGLRALARHDPTLGEIARLRLLHGLELDEIAVSLEMSVWAAKREWSTAKMWLRRYCLGQLRPEDLRLRAETQDVGRWNDQSESRH